MRGDIIGAGGRVVKQITEASGVTALDVNDQGLLEVRVGCREGIGEILLATLLEFLPSPLPHLHPTCPATTYPCVC